MNKMLVIGVGNAYRCDDAVGLIVAQRLRALVPPGITVLEQSGEGATLMEAWQDADHVILVDAAFSGEAPGTIHRFEAAVEPIPAQFFNYSTHAFSVAEAVEMARQLDKLPPSLIVYGIEGRSFSFGQDLSLEVEQAARAVVAQVLQELSG
jgi:hydrogenase maturation protease